MLDAVEDLYAAFDDSTLPALQVVSLVGAIDEYLQGAARTMAIEEQEVDQDRRQLRGVLGRAGVVLAEVLRRRAVPDAPEALGARRFRRQPLGYEFGLARILDGIEVLIAAGSRG